MQGKTGRRQLGECPAIMTGAWLSQPRNGCVCFIVCLLVWLCFLAICLASSHFEASHPMSKAVKAFQCDYVIVYSIYIYIYTVYIYILFIVKIINLSWGERNLQHCKLHNVLGPQLTWEQVDAVCGRFSCCCRGHSSAGCQQFVVSSKFINM